jgi:hypothetical protein
MGLLAASSLYRKVWRGASKAVKRSTVQLLKQVFEDVIIGTGTEKSYTSCYTFDHEVVQVPNSAVISAVTDLIQSKNDPAGSFLMVGVN